ncbi:hypothetical protein [Arthrobacter sp. A5]|uniref:hypothetical protein n=1 Tax=Arthrobacter sp. A5 TaxID=576926 RepID=UPI003DA96C0B
MKDRPRSRTLVLTGAALTFLVGGLIALPLVASSATNATAAKAVALVADESSRLLPAQKLILKSAKQVDLTNNTVRLPLHRGVSHGHTVWYILTESSDVGLAADLGVNYAAKLTNLGVSCPTCVQTVTQTSAPDLKFGEATVAFTGAPDFSPRRVLVPGPTTLPATTVQPGAVGGPGYSPFIRIEGSPVVYNAPIVATGDGPFDVTTHSNTGDRVLAIHPADRAGPGQFTQATVDLLFIHGFDAGQPILYISTEASDPLAAVLERATYVPLLNQASFRGGDDALGSGRERIFPFLNGQSGAGNPNAQGLIHLIKDGHATEDANLGNDALLAALRNGGDALNIQGDFPTITDPRHALSYSPLWDAQLGEWTDEAVEDGLNKLQTDENQILNLAATRPDLLTGPGGAAYGSVGFVINCPVIAFTNEEPKADLVDLVPNAQG